MDSERNESSKAGAQGIWRLVEKAAARVPGWVEQTAPRAASTLAGEQGQRAKEVLDNQAG